MADLKTFIEKLQVYEPKFQESLVNYSTWRIGGPAEILVVSRNSWQLECLVNLCLSASIPYTILGEGSNVLISDRGLKGLVIINQSRNIEFTENQLTDYRTKEMQETTLVESRYTEMGDKEFYSFADLDYDEENLAQVQGKVLHKVRVSLDSGVKLSYAIAKTLEQGLTGLQWFAGIPGTIGGALYNNIHGGTKHLSDYFASAEVLLPIQTDLDPKEIDTLIKALDRLENYLENK